MFLLSLALLAALPAEGQGEVYAVIVGHNGGLAAGSERALPTLRYADDDALRFARWFEPLVTPGGLFVLTTPDDETLTTLASAGVDVPQTRSPTRRALFDVFEQVKARLSKRSGRGTVFFFYAGHGLTGRLLLSPEAGDVASLTGKELKLALADLGADHVELFIDACRSQSLFTDRGGPDLSAEIAALETRARTTAFGVLTAAQSDKPAGEASDLRGGLFSHVLASGLAGAADADGDEVIRFGELAAFVAFNTEGLTGQRPWFEAPGGDLSTPVVRLTGTTRLALPESSTGRLRVSLEKGLPVVAEVFKAKGRRLALTLPSGRYVVEQRDGAELAADVELSMGEVKVVPELSMTRPRRSERGELEWESASFIAPFSSQVVAALDAGYLSARPSAEPTTRRFAAQAAFVLAPAPFGLAGTEQGFEVGARFQLAGLALGLRGSLRFSSVGEATFRRLALNVLGGWRFSFEAARLSLTPFATAGTRSIWRLAGTRLSGDPLAPSLGGGLQLDWRAASWLSLWAEARGEVTFVAIDGVRAPFGEPTLVVGVSTWLF